MLIQKNPQKQNRSKIAVIRYIYKMVIFGHSCNEIAVRLNTRKDQILSPHGGLWTSTAIRRIVQNPIYAGIVVTGRTKKLFNPLTEKPYIVKLPSTQWLFFEDSRLKGYKIVSSAIWIRAQTRISGFGKRSGKQGRPAGTFGPSLLSGLLYCGHCGAALVSGGGVKTRHFRCSSRRLRTGNPKRCGVSFSIREDLMIQVLSSVLKNTLVSMADDCIRIMNQEFYEAGDAIRYIIKEKVDNCRRLKEREECLIQLIEKAKSEHLTVLFTDYFNKIAVIKKELIDAEKKLTNLRNANELSLKPMEIDQQVFLGQIEILDQLCAGTTDVVPIRTAIRSFLPKIFVMVKDFVEQQFDVLTFRIDEIPAGLSDIVKEQHEFIIAHKRGVDVKTDLITTGKVEEKNLLVQAYDNMSDRYLIDKLSYTPLTIVPMYWQVVIPQRDICNETDFGDSLFYTHPYAVNEFGFENHERIMGKI